MMFNKNNKKGFTLIELLVVISIIAVLASVVLAGLSGARKKNNDTKIKAQLDSVRKNAALYYSTNGNYGTLVATCTGVFFLDGTSGMKTVTSQAIYPTGANITCGTNGQAYAVAAIMSNSLRWCVDSTGASKQMLLGTTDPSAGGVSCS